MAKLLIIELPEKLGALVKGLKAAKVKGEWEPNSLDGFMTYIEALSDSLQEASGGRAGPTHADKASFERLTVLHNNVENIVITLKEKVGNTKLEASSGVKAWLKAAGCQAFGEQLEMQLKEAKDMVQAYQAYFESAGTSNKDVSALLAKQRSRELSVKLPPKYKRHQAFEMVCAHGDPLSMLMQEFWKLGFSQMQLSRLYGQ